MKKATTTLIERIIERPDAFFVTRKEENYDHFLDLYQRVGYAPGTSEDIARWRERSRHTWRAQDSILQASCTGGLDGGKVVSSWGTLPIAKNILYGHSVCMEKTVASAATLFARSLYSIDQMERHPTIGYWAGSYANHSRFTSLFQRPNGWKIAGQLELEVVRLLQRDQSRNGIEPQLAVGDITKDHLGCIAPFHLQWIDELREKSPLLANLHSCKTFALTEPSSGALRCIAIAQNVPREFTAANVFSWTWVFPAIGVLVNETLYAALRSVPDLQSADFQLALSGMSDFSANERNDPAHPAFWVLTPRSQLASLKRSFEEAFSTLLDRYSEHDLDDFVRQRESVRG